MRPIGSHAPGRFAHRAFTLRIIALLLAMLPVLSGTAASTTLAREADEGRSLDGPAVQGIVMGVEGAQPLRIPVGEPTSSEGLTGSDAINAVLPGAVEAFDAGLGDWTIVGNVGVVQAASLQRPAGFQPVDQDPGAAAFPKALLCTGPDQVQAADSNDNVDQDAGGNSENDQTRMTQVFTLNPNQVPATLSFDWSFLTAESDGTVIPNPFDDVFRVQLNGSDILSGSVPGGGISPWTDVAVDGIEIDVTSPAPVTNCQFEFGKSDFQTFQMLLTGPLAAPTQFTLEFFVADQGDNDFFIDSGLLIDNVMVMPEVDLSVTKTAQPSPAIAGEPLFYEITVENQASGRATEVTVVDTLPLGVTFVAADAPPVDIPPGGVVEFDPACVEAPVGTITCRLRDLVGGDSETFQIQVEVDDDLVATGVDTITNRVVVDSFQVETAANEIDNTFELVTFVDDLADLRILKVSKPDDEIRAGETFTYTLLVENLGPSYARNVRLADNMFASGNFTLVNIFDDPNRVGDVCNLSPATPPLSGQNIDCVLNEALESVQSAVGTGRWEIQIEATAAQTQDINNTVRVYSDDTPDVGTPDPDLSNNQAIDNISILDTSNLLLTKTAIGNVHDPADCATITPTADQVTAGDQVTYLLTVTNQDPGPPGNNVPGGSDAPNVTIEDFLPPWLEVISIVGNGPDGPAGCNPGTPGNFADPARCNVGMLIPGNSATVTIVALVDPDYIGLSESRLIQNSARTYSDNIDPDERDNRVIQTTTVTEVADLVLTKESAPDPVIAGTPLSYELRVWNNGPSTAREVVVRDQLPPEVEFRNATVENQLPGEVCTYAAGAHEVICSLHAVSRGNATTGRLIFINTFVKADTLPGGLVNTASAFSDQTPDCNTANNLAITEPTVVETQADVAIMKTSDPVKVFAGEQKQYHIWVENLGPSDAQNVTVYDILPDEVVYEIDTNSPMCTQPANLLGFRAPLAGAGTNAMGLATFVLNTDTNELIYGVQLNDIANVTEVHLHRIAGAVTELTLYGGGVPAPSPTEPLQGRVIIPAALATDIAGNPGGFAIDVHVGGNPVPEITGVLAQTRNAPLHCPIGLLPPVQPHHGYRPKADDPGTHHFDIWALVRPETLAGTTITNVAMVTSDTSLGDPDTTNNIDSSKNLVLGKSDLRITKFGKNDGEVRAGEILTYTVIVDNLGPSWAEGVAVKDLLQSAGVFDLIDLTSDRPMRCKSLPAFAPPFDPDGYVVVPGEPWPVTNPPPPFGVLPLTGIENINQRLEVDCELTEAINPDPLVTTPQLGVLAADGPPNSGRWILTMRVRAEQAQDMDNVADVVTTHEETNLENNHAEVEHEITDVADLSIVKTMVGEVQVDGQPGLIFDINNGGLAFPQAGNYTTSPTNVTAGRRIRYTLDIRNNGPSDAENVIISDRLPPGVTLIPGTIVTTIGGVLQPTGQCETGTPGDVLDQLVCGLGMLRGINNAALSVAQIQFDVLVDPALPAGAVLENDVSVSSDIFDPDNQNNHAFVQTIVNNWADLSASKDAVGENVTGYDATLGQFIIEDIDDAVTAGLVLRYEIAVQNNGPGDAQNVIVRDDLPDMPLPGPLTLLRSVGADCRPDDVEDFVLFCTVGDLPAGARRTFDLYFQVDPSVPEGTVLTNCVSTLFATTTPPAQPGPLPGPPPVLPLTDDPFDTNNVDICNDTTVNAVADIGGPGMPGDDEFDDFISKKDVPAEPRLDKIHEPDHALAGEEHRYLITFGNAGPSTALGVGIIDLMDFKQPGLTGETFVRCEPLDPDDLVTCSYDPVTNQVTVEEFLVHNEALIPAAGTGVLLPGKEYSFYLIAMVDKGYVLDASNTMPEALNSEPGAITRNTVQISTTTTDFRTANDRDTERTRIIAEADLGITKTDIINDPNADPANAFLQCDPVVPGGMITYTVVVTNTGPSDAADVFVVDRLPQEGVVLDPAQVMVDVTEGEVVEVRDDGRITLRIGNGENNAGVPELGRLNCGDAVTVTIQVMVRQDAECGSMPINVARVETRENEAMWPPVVVGPPEGPGGVSPTEPRTPTLDPKPGNNITAEGTTIECPKVAIDKTISFDGECPGRNVTLINDPGQPVTFCFEIMNMGTTYLDTIRITDTLTTRTTMPTIIFTDTITFGKDPKVPVAPGESVMRKVTVPHFTKECGIASDRVEVTANPVNSGRTDLPCLPIVMDEDEIDIEIPCAGVDFRIQLPVINNSECETWVQVQNVGDEPSIPLLVAWGQAGFCPPQAAGPLKSECGGLLRPGSAWSFAGGQIPQGAESAIVYSLSAELIEIQPGTKIPFGALVCDEFFFNVVGDYLDWTRFDIAYKNRGVFNDLDFGKYPGEPMAISVNRTCPDPTNPNNAVSAAYTGVSSDVEGAADPTFGGYGYYAPMVFAEQAGLNTVLHIQNSGILCTSLELWFKGQDNCLRPILGDVLALAPGETVHFDASTVVGPGWIGSAWVRATQPMGIIVDTFGPNHFTSYTATPADVYELDFTYGNQVNFAPLIYSEYQGWDTAIQVQNLSGTHAAKVQAVFLDRSGDIITTLFDWICPRGTQTFFLPAIASLPGNWVGSARVESQIWWAPGTKPIDPPKIASVVLLEKWSDPARTARREAVAYNAQTECLLFDWQVGGGKGGTASGSAVFAVPLLAKGNRGITSEIAITNLVPKPGFTDFAMFIYDQNGLIDYDCEKLHDRQVEYVDLQTWGSVPPGFLGSLIVSATFWEHEVFDGTGGFVRNLVGLGGVAVERVGTSPLGGDVPGDESKAFEAFPVFDHFMNEGKIRCPGQPAFDLR